MQNKLMNLVGLCYNRNVRGRRQQPLLKFESQLYSVRLGDEAEASTVSLRLHFLSHLRVDFVRMKLIHCEMQKNFNIRQAAKSKNLKSSGSGGAAFSQISFIEQQKFFSVMDKFFAGNHAWQSCAQQPCLLNKSPLVI